MLSLPKMYSPLGVGGSEANAASCMKPQISNLFKTSLITFCTMLVIGIKLGAQSTFTLKAEVRPRTEYRHGFKKLINPATQNAAFFTDQRTRLITTFSAPKYDFMVSYQDVRIWGEEAQVYKPTVGSGSAFAAVNQAWANLKFSKKTSLKLGRQEWDYDNVRILGNLAWAQQSRSHDGALLVVKDSVQQFHLGAAYNQDGKTPEQTKLLETFYNVTGNYKTMQFLWYHRDFKKGGLSLLALNNGQQAKDSSTYYTQTLGGIGNIKLKKIKLELEAYYQTGKEAAGKDVNAWLLAASLTAPLGKKGNVVLGADYLSGSSLDDAASQNNSFNPLYGTHHKFYGYMDYFYVGNASAQMSRTIGLIDPYLRFNVPVGKKANLQLTGHQFISPVDIYSVPEQKTTKLSNTLGTEIDLVLSTAITPDVKIEAGYSQLFATESMAKIKGGDYKALQNWAYCMITFSPTLLISKL